ncbi:DUF6906 family protein [Paenibacillus pabuli]|uniref:DUF6906 family protein n=1 Tax=Paenibacillus pabuli TaxID=1472 RepID=UPI000AE5E925|nr:hypothetical protein [Paenibacillus pabuli]MEC0125320.1 hypothetical protein [Paenibacillus pabuli]
MKQGKRPTKRQKMEIKVNGLNADNWLVERDLPSMMVIVHRFSGKARTIRRGA